MEPTKPFQCATVLDTGDGWALFLLEADAEGTLCKIRQLSEPMDRQGFWITGEKSLIRIAEGMGIPYIRNAYPGESAAQWMAAILRGTNPYDGVL